jgi:hypothetical protein
MGSLHFAISRSVYLTCLYKAYRIDPKPNDQRHVFVPHPVRVSLLRNVFLVFWRVHDASISFFTTKKIFLFQGAKKDHGVMAYVSTRLQPMQCTGRDGRRCVKLRTHVSWEIVYFAKVDVESGHPLRGLCTEYAFLELANKCLDTKFC